MINIDKPCLTRQVCALSGGLGSMSSSSLFISRRFSKASVCKFVRY